MKLKFVIAGFWLNYGSVQKRSRRNNKKCIFSRRPTKRILSLF